MAGRRLYAVIEPYAPGRSWRFLNSTDLGQTWTEMPLPQLTPFVTPSAPPQNGIYDRISYGFSAKFGLLLNDGARTWRVAPGSDLFEPDDQAFPIVSVSSLTRSDTILAVSADTSKPHPKVTEYVNTDGGAHWQRVKW
jgi:hypothetical protein